MRKTHVRRGDLVEVISGNHKGATGKVLQVLINNNQPNKKSSHKKVLKEQVIVEGVRIIKRHLRRSQEHPEGTILEQEGPIHLSNVRLLERDGKAVTSEATARKKAPKKAAKTSKKDSAFDASSEKVEKKASKKSND